MTTHTDKSKCSTAVVILNWNGEKLLREFLPQVVKHTPPHLADIIVADNASSDGNPYREGYVELGMKDDETTVDFSIRLIEMRTEGDSEDWAIPFADSVNISEMSESDMNSAQMGLVGVIGEVAATLQEQFPIFEQLFAEMDL